MKYVVTCMYVLFSVLIIKPETLLTYELEKGIKIKTTYSGKYGEDQILHCIITKDKNNDDFVLTTYLKNSLGIEKISVDRSSTEPKILAHHVYNGRIVLVVKNETTLLSVVIDPTKKSSQLNTITRLEEAEDIAPLEDKTLILNTNKDENRIELYAVQGDKLTTLSIDYPTSLKSKKQNIGPIDYLDQTKYVESGSNNRANLYALSKHHFALVIEDEERNLTVFQIDLENSNSRIEQKEFAFDTEVPQAIDGDYYIFNEKLFKLGMTKENISISIFDLRTGEKLKSISMDELVSQSNASQKDLEKYTKKLRRSAFDPVLTVNENSAKDLILRLDYVDNRVYNYNTMLMDMMLQQQMMQQQQMMNNVPKFGPNPPVVNDEHYSSIDEETSFTFVLSPDLSFTNSKNINPVAEDFENKDQINKHIGHKNRSKVSGVFTQNTLHLVFYNTYKREVTIAEEPREVED